MSVWVYDFVNNYVFYFNLIIRVWIGFDVWCYRKGIYLIMCNVILGYVLD